MTLALELSPHLPGSVDAEVFAPDTPDLGAQGIVAFGPIRPPGRVALFRLPGVIGGRRDPQFPANRLDADLPAMIVDERDHIFDPRSITA